MAETWALLGDLEFILADSPESFSHNRRVRLPEHDVINRRPAVQFTGRELETLKLGFLWHVGWCDPDAQLKRLWQAQDAHEPMRLVLGAGTWRKKWLIEQVSSTLRQTDPRGATLSIECQVNLKESGINSRQSRQRTGRAVRTSGFAAFARR